MFKKLLAGCFMLMALVLAGCGGDSADPTVKGAYRGDLHIAIPGDSVGIGPATLVIEDDYRVSGSWAPLVTPPGTTILLTFVGSSTAEGVVTASGYNGTSEVIRIAGTANASSGVFSGSFTFISLGRTVPFTLTRQ